ncbi:MAG: hypothetical protein E7643_09400 [Ruminococcaceae bacterium]|nr:hypothetical protein [Oscillospiraceae bacterium]
MTLTERAAYIKGLAEGLELDKESKEGKIIAALMELCTDMASEIASIKEDIEEIDEGLDYLDEYVEELDDDLQAVEDYLDEECEDEDDSYDFSDDDFDGDFDCDGDCEACDGCDCENDDYYEIVCPSCGETVCFDQELDPENLVCPACGEAFGCIVDEEDFKKLSEEEEN